MRRAAGTTRQPSRPTQERRRTPTDVPTLDVSVVLPCRDETTTVGLCVERAGRWMQRRALSGEIVVVDNASLDDSAVKAASAGARVVYEAEPGYGVAVHTGVLAANGTVVIIADADGTYDLAELDGFYDPIATHRADAVIGNRFALDAPPAAMNRWHRWGNRVLSALARHAGHVEIRDFHCGLRSFSRASLAGLPSWSPGMESATHMVLASAFAGYRIEQSSTVLGPAAPGRRSKLRPVRDGCRHLAVIAQMTRRRRQNPRGYADGLTPPRSHETGRCA